MYVRDLRDAGPSCGGKAYGLSRLIAARLPVPAGFALDHTAFRFVVGDIVAPTDADGPDDIGGALETAACQIATVELPSDLERDVIERATQLGHHVVVRSSATLEDGDTGSAAGIFASHTCTSKEVWHAIRNVWTSALTPLAVAYARRRRQAISITPALPGLSALPNRECGVGSIGVVVQRQAPGDVVTVYTRPPGSRSSDEILVQRGSELTRISRAVAAHRVADRHAVEMALRAERAIGAEDSGADVELVQAVHQPHETWIVQARPIVHPVARVLMAPPPIVTAPLRDGRVWTWDVAHNPDPLSPAQSGLVERVERAGLGAYSLRVCAGYLYSTPRTDVIPPPAPRNAAELATRAQALEANAAAILAAPTATLADAIEQYLAFYAIWSGELAPLIASARSVRTSASAHRRPSSVEVTLAKATRGEIAMAEVETRLGDLSPAWDVAVPAFGDRPGLLREAVALFSSVAGHPDGESAGRADTESLAAIAADLAERDDLLFARAQRLVRRALIARAHDLQLDPDDVFWLPLDEVVTGVAVDSPGSAGERSTPSGVRSEIDAESARRRAAGAKAAAERAAQWRMPLTIGGDAQSEIGGENNVLRGVGQGPRVTGRVVRFASLASAMLVGPGDVVVVRAVTPALAVFLGRCTALVSETGGLLDHAAAMARELAIPCVVGCADACSRLHDGMLVTVDGDAGEVIPAGI